MASTPRFSGLKLKAAERRVLQSMSDGRARESARTWRRIRTLLLLDGGNSIRATALAVGGYPREVSRVAKRYLDGGVEKALIDDDRPKPPRILDSAQEAALIALICGPAPEGRARWTIRLAVTEAIQRGIVDDVGRETVRVLLAAHDLKPWREKNVVRSAHRQRVRREDGGHSAPLRKETPRR